MKIRYEVVSGQKILFVDELNEPFKEAQDIAEILMNGLYSGCDRMVLDADQLVEEFYDLSSGLAGVILQKFSTYGGYLAIIGDFTKYPSKQLPLFIEESNRQGRIQFVTDLEAAIAAFAG